MANRMISVRQPVVCTACGSALLRVVWNYGRQRPITRYFCDTKCKGEWQRKQREEGVASKEWLTEQYVSKGRSANEIAREVGRDPKRVWEWLINYGVELRPRGHNTSHLPKDGSTFRGKRHTAEARQAQRERRLMDGHVPYLKDGIHWLKATGRKPATWKGGISPERQAFYATQAWKDAVKAVWKRANAICERCGKDHRLVKDRRAGGFHVHHVDSFKIVARRADAGNLVLLCNLCHRWVHSSRNTGREFLGLGH